METPKPQGRSKRAREVRSGRIYASVVALVGAALAWGAFEASARCFSERSDGEPRCDRIFSGGCVGFAFASVAAALALLGAYRWVAVPMTRHCEAHDRQSCDVCRMMHEFYDDFVRERMQARCDEDRRAFAKIRVEYNRVVSRRYEADRAQAEREFLAARGASAAGKE